MSTKNWLRFWAAGLIWGTSFLWIKLALQETSPLILVAFRTLFAGITSLIIVLIIKKIKITWQLIRSWLWLFLLLGLINAVIPFILISWGEQYISSGIASVLNSTAPIFTGLMASFLIREDRMTAKKIAGVLIGFSGVVLLFLPSFFQSEIKNLLGIAAVLFSAFLYATSGIILKRRVYRLDSDVQVMLQYLFAAMITWGIVFVFEKPIEIPRLALTWVGLLWLGVLGSSVASSIYFKLLHEVGPTRSSTVLYIPPLAGLLLGALILGEPLGWQTLAGGGLILAGIVLVHGN
jgi:drug/metabolite transporter (DMT)-like permease